MPTSESREIVEWLTILFDPAAPLPGGRPLRLIGAAVESVGDATPRLRVRCRDGSEFVIMFVPLGYAPWRQEQIEQERRAREASPEYQKQLADVLSRAEQMARETHSGHPGGIEECRHPACRSALGFLAALRGEERPVRPPDIDPFF